jgi:hypothetical protein
MDAETREDFRRIYKRIEDLEKEQESKMDTVGDTIKEVRDAILGKMDGSGGGGLQGRLQKLETEFQRLRDMKSTVEVCTTRTSSEGSSTMTLGIFKIEESKLRMLLYLGGIVIIVLILVALVGGTGAVKLLKSLLG